MFWGNSAGPRGPQDERDQRQDMPQLGVQSERNAANVPTPPYAIGQAPTPPYPFNQAPTPPYQPGQTPTPPYQPNQTPTATPPYQQGKTGSPLQRLADAHRAPRAQAQARPPSAHPDGTPAPLPASVISRLSSSGEGRSDSKGESGSGRSRVIQRFSGSGLAPKTKVQRQERRARRATGVLALAAVVLIASSAILIFDPAIELPSFGFALNQRLHKQTSNVPLYVDGTQPPTPSSGTTSPTPSGSNGGPNTKPTATPRPTSPPTPIPTVIPSGAVVRFTPTSSQISKNSFTGCGGGCNFQTRNTSASSSGQGGPISSTGWQSVAVGGGLHVRLNGVARCNSNTGGCSGVTQRWFGIANVTFHPGPAPTCTIAVPQVSSGQTVDTGMCPWWYTRSTSYASYGSLVNGATTYYVENLGGGWFIQWNFAYWNNNWPSQASYWFVQSQDCNNVIGSADTNARNTASSAQSSWIGGNVALYRSSPQIVNDPNVRKCSPQAGTISYNGALRVTGYSAAAWSATAFDPNAVVSAASGWVQSQVPANYTLTAGPTTCSASQAGSSGNYSYSGGYNGALTVTCAASGTATYDWSSAGQGLTAQNTLKAAIEGKSLSQAKNICNSFAGIDHSTPCQIQLIGGNVSIIPSSPGLIQILPS